MFDVSCASSFAALVPGAPFILRLRPKGTRILAQFGAPSVGVPGAGLLEGPMWTTPVDTGLAPRTDRLKAIAWARTAFPGADVQWETGRVSSKKPAPLSTGDGMAGYGDGQAAPGLPIVSASQPTL